MNTKHGAIPAKMWADYKGKLINKVYKILPLKEEGSSTVDVHIDSVLFEIIGNKKMMLELEDHGELVAVLGILQNLIDEDDIKTVKREVFKCLDILKKI